MKSYQERYEAVMMRTFPTPARQLVRGEGVYVWDSEGRRYLDLLAGIAVNSTGHSHPQVVAALREQLGQLVHTSNFFATAPQLALAEKLAEIIAEAGYTQPARVFFTNSGTEANEAALKIARAHKPGGKILGLEGSFHGRTFGALSVTSKASLREPFAPLVGQTGLVPATVAGIESGVDDSVAALFVEPIQGEAGVVPLAPEVLQTARQACDRHNALLIIDEVQTGVGRTGSWLASSETVRGDVVTLAKGLGSGVPVGACIGIGKAGELLGPGDHGSTFGGNPLATRAALATLEVISGYLQSGHVQATGTWLQEELSAAGYAVRGKGLLLGIAVENASELAAELLEAGFIVNPANANTLRIAPPLGITREELAPFAEFMREKAALRG